MQTDALRQCSRQCMPSMTGAHAGWRSPAYGLHCPRSRGAGDSQSYLAQAKDEPPQAAPYVRPLARDQGSANAKLQTRNTGGEVRHATDD